jgi:hypothetical protein
MSNFIKAHGIKIANGGAIENAVIEKLNAAPSSLESGRLYYDTTSNQMKYVKLNNGTATVYTVASAEEAQSFVSELSTLSGSTLVGSAGITGSNGEFSTTDGTVKTNLDAIVAGLDAEIKRAKTAESTETSARTAADTAIEATITALKDGSTSTIANLDAMDADLGDRITELEANVGGATGDMTTLTTDHKTTLVGAINEVDAHIDAEVTRATGAESTITSNLTAEVTRATGAEATLQSSIDDEASRAQSAEGTLQDNIDAEVARAEAAEADLESSIQSEVTRVDTNFLNKTTSALQEVVAPVKLKSSLVVDGDLTVKGGNFVTEAEVVTFADNILELNSNVITGEPLEDAGLVVRRGDEGVLAILTWDETNDKVTIPVKDLIDNGDGTFDIGQDEVVGMTLFSTEIDAINAQLASSSTGIQSELDATQTGAGLQANGTYSANSSANYIASATSLKDADNKLDEQVKVNTDAIATETARAESAEADLDSAIQTEASTRADADTALDARVTTVEGQVNGKIGELTSLTTDAKSTIVAAVNEVDAHIDAEVSRATAAEDALTSDLSDEIDRATAAEGVLTTNLASEVSRATAAEATITGSITALKDGSTSTIKNLDDAIATTVSNLNAEIANRTAADTAEQTARENADTAIVNSITALKDGSTSTIKNLDDAIAAETARATGAESTINGSISTLKSSINSMYYSYTAETPATSFAVAHNLATDLISVQVWVYDETAERWKNDIVAVEQVDTNNIVVLLSESRKVKVVVAKVAAL